MTGRMLVTGASGYLGRWVATRATAAGWAVTGTYLTRPTETADEWLDICEPGAAARTLARVRPQVVVHTACGRDRADWRANADGAAYVAVAAAASGKRLVHVSSDAVFSGRHIEYDESALPDPIYPYGAAKAAAETAVRAVAPTAAVVRTSLILGDGHGNHEVLTHQLATGQRDGMLFTDEIRTPVHVADLADALIELAGSDYVGVLNVAGPEAVSRYHLGIMVAHRDGLDPQCLTAGTSAASDPLRPRDVRLRVDRAVSLLGTRLRGAGEFLA